MQIFIGHPAIVSHRRVSVTITTSARWDFSTRLGAVVSDNCFNYLIGLDRIKSRLISALIKTNSSNTYCWVKYLWRERRTERERERGGGGGGERERDEHDKGSDFLHDRHAGQPWTDTTHSRSRLPYNFALRASQSPFYEKGLFSQ